MVYGTHFPYSMSSKINTMVHDSIIQQLLLERITSVRKGLSTIDLMLSVYSRTRLDVTAKDVNRVITKMVNEGDLIRLAYRPGGSTPQVEEMFFSKGTIILNLEEVIENQRSNTLGKKGIRDKEIPRS